ncbi:MAG: acyl-CoA dehydrogenase [Alphaproteobacteria bacterium]|nr:acyl-CoA dehydrogenase [Alphaproteobacteria bacterium]MDE2495944.1 acyl-CoA dehydrogenase [Alphaproteobacteria bacterium]
MTDYTAPIADMRFAVTRLADFAEVTALPGNEELSEDLLDAIFAEAGKFASGVLAPLNRVGDLEGSQIENGVVRTPEGWPAAYRAFVDGGWNAVPFTPSYGGQGLPWLLGTALQEMWHSANMAFSLCPMLTQAAVEAISLHGSSELKSQFLPKMISGHWTGTMNLTEPDAGSDLAAIRTRAVRENSHYRIRGQKVFITYGDHELAENIVHLVLARLSDAPAGVKGISLFVVPKHLTGANGATGERNDVRCVSLENKMGIHASPTAVMSYGDTGGAVGFLVGEENKGLQYMFTTMNNARLSVGVQGIGVAERALQKAGSYARQRVQGRDIAGDSSKPVTIIRHPDVRRMLLTMRALTEASRALAYFAAAKLDIANRHHDDAVCKRAQAIVDLLIPVVKGWGTEIGSEAASLGVQVHGGTGYIEETGAAQFMRDAKIAEIYEGTNGIQANDLIGRKLTRDDGATAKSFIQTMRSLVSEREARDQDISSLLGALATGLDHLDAATDWMLGAHRAADPQAAAAGAMPYLRLWGTVAGGWLMARAALAAKSDQASGNGDSSFLRAKIITARFYGEHILPRASSLAASATAGANTVMTMPDEAL